MNTLDHALKALYKAEKVAWARAGAYLAIRDKDVIKIKVAYPRDGTGLLQVWVWGEHGMAHGAASGYGYDKLSTALSGMSIGYGVDGESVWRGRLESIRDEKHHMEQRIIQLESRLVECRKRLRELEDAEKTNKEKETHV